MRPRRPQRSDQGSSGSRADTEEGEEVNRTRLCEPLLAGQTRMTESVGVCYMEDEEICTQEKY